MSETWPDRAFSALITGADGDSPVSREGLGMGCRFPVVGWLVRCDGAWPFGHTPRDPPPNI